MIAQVGGFFGRKSDGEPGAKTIWRGLDQVFAAAETLRALGDGLGWLMYKYSLAFTALPDVGLGDTLIWHANYKNVA